MGMNTFSASVCRTRERNVHRKNNARNDINHEQHLRDIVYLQTDRVNKQDQLRTRVSGKMESEMQ